MNEYLDFAKNLAAEAGEVLLKYFQAEKLGLQIKEDNSPVTIADTEVNNLVISRVKQHFPGHGVLGEEASINLESSQLWIVDPLDGTSSFARGLEDWAFSLAYVENGKPKVGVVYDPILRRMMWAAEGDGAFENDRKLTLPNTIPDGFLEVSSWIGGGNKIVVFKDAVTESETHKAYSRHGGISLTNLPIAHALALTGAGRLHAAATSCVNPWDLAAGALIAQEAGAKVTDIFGRQVQRWDKNIPGALAAPPAVHQLLLDILLPVLNKAETQ